MNLINCPILIKKEDEKGTYFIASSELDSWNKADEVTLEDRQNIIQNNLKQIDEEQKKLENIREMKEENDSSSQYTLSRQVQDGNKNVEALILNQVGLSRYCCRTHMIGHELTALHGLDHAVTLAIVLPSLMFVQRDKKQEKILQLGERVFGIQEDDKEKAIDLTIKAVQDFFETMQVKTRLSDHNIEKSAIDGLIENLERNGLTALGEHGDIDLAKAREILTLAA